MSRFKTSKVITRENALERPEEWDYFADLELMKSRGSSAFKTCEYLTYVCDTHESLFFTCPPPQQLIPQAEHLTKLCRNWQQK